MTEAAVRLKWNERQRVIEGVKEEMQAAIQDLKTIRFRLLGVKASLSPTAQETSREDLEGDPDLETELRTVVDHGIQSCLDSLIDDFEAAVEYQPEPWAGGSLSIAHLDLRVFSEATQKGLYEVVAAESFEITEPPPGEGSTPQYTAEQAGLEVVFVWGRWFATWWKLELPDTLPEAERREILLLQENRQRPGTLAYGEV